MVNCLSKKLAHNEWQEYNLNAIEIIKKAYQTPFLTKDILANVDYSSRDERGEDNQKRTLDDINKSCGKYSWLCGPGRGYMTEYRKRESTISRESGY